MKLSKSTVLSGILFCGLGVLLAGMGHAVSLESSRALLLLFIMVSSVGAFQLYARERKARVPAPVKIRRKEPPIIIRRRPGQW